jgi:hypothetical protein
VNNHSANYRKGNPAANRTPKKFGNKNPQGNNPHKTPKVVVKATPTREYLCTECRVQVTKTNRCGTLLQAAGKGSQEKRAGLGRFKCVCGSKTVSVKILKIEKVDKPAELSAAA